MGHNKIIELQTYRTTIGFEPTALTPSHIGVLFVSFLQFNKVIKYSCYTTPMAVVYGWCRASFVPSFALVSLNHLEYQLRIPATHNDCGPRLHFLMIFRETYAIVIWNPRTAKQDRAPTSGQKSPVQSRLKRGP